MIENMGVVVPMLVAGGLLLVVLAVIALARADYDSRNALVTLLICASIWVLSASFEHSSSTLPAKILATKISYAGILGLPVALLALAIIASRGAGLPRYFWALPMFSSICFLAVITNELHSLIWNEVYLTHKGGVELMAVKYGPGFWFIGLLTNLELVAATWVLLSHYWRNWERSAVLVYVGLLMPWIANSFYLARLGPLPDLDLTPFALIVTGLCFAIMFRGAEGSFSVLAFASRDIVEHMRDLVLVVDRRNRIQLANAAARDQLELPRLPVAAEVALGSQQGLLDVICDTNPSIDCDVFGDTDSSRIYHARSMPLVNRKTKTIKGLILVLRDITDQREAEKQLHRRRDQLRRVFTAVESTADSISIYRKSGELIYVNQAYLDHTGWDLEHTKTSLAWELSRPNKFDEISDVVSGGKSWKGQLRTLVRDGRYLDEEGTISPVVANDGRITHYVSVMRDVTEKLVMEKSLAQSQKLESIGQLAAGIAHEINTPTQYVGDNTRFVQESFGEIEQFFDSLHGICESANGSIPTKDLKAILDEADIDFLRQEVPLALMQSLDGLGRVATIVRAMKDFSHPGKEKTTVNLNDAIQSTLTVASSEWKNIAELHTEFDSTMAPVRCMPGEINQVFLNLVVNAAHAIEDNLADSSAEKGLITITTCQLDDQVEIRISDNGIGMPADTQERIFDPFFTTKEVGKGTGQGLSIAHDVVVNRHGGSIKVESEPGQGTCFIIQLPTGAKLEADPEYC